MPQHLVSGPLRDQVGVIPKSWLASLWVFDPVWGEHPSATSKDYLKYNYCHHYLDHCYHYYQLIILPPPSATSSF